MDCKATRPPMCPEWATRAPRAAWTTESSPLNLHFTNRCSPSNRRVLQVSSTNFSSRWVWSSSNHLTRRMFSSSRRRSTVHNPRLPRARRRLILVLAPCPTGSAAPISKFKRAPWSSRPVTWWTATAVWNWVKARRVTINKSCQEWRVNLITRLDKQLMPILAHSVSFNNWRSPARTRTSTTWSSSS